MINLCKGIQGLFLHLHSWNLPEIKEGWSKIKYKEKKKIGL